MLAALMLIPGQIFQILVSVLATVDAVWLIVETVAVHCQGLASVMRCVKPLETAAQTLAQHAVLVSYVQ